MAKWKREQKGLKSVGLESTRRWAKAGRINKEEIEGNENRGGKLKEKLGNIDALIS